MKSDLSFSSRWSLVGMVVGVMFAMFSAVRYFLIYYDLDRALVYIVIGFLIGAVSWLYGRQLELNNTLDYIEEQLEAKWKKI